MKIIGLVGYAQTGKNSLAERIIRHFPEYTQIAFADALKKDCSNFIDLVTHYRFDFIHDESAKKRFRPLLVGWGEAMRELDSEYWINRIKDRITSGGCFVVTDVRYENEVIAIKKLGGMIVYVNRPDFGPANDIEAGSINRIMNTPILIDEIVNNNGDLNKLDFEAMDLIWRLKNGNNKDEI